MASLDVSGIGDVLGDLGRIDQIPDATKRQMLQAAGNVLADAQRAACPAKTGTLKNSITVGHYKSTASGSSIEVFFDGVHHTSPQGEQLNARIANVLEFGSAALGIAPRQFIRAANEKAKDEAIDAAAAVFAAAAK